MNLMFINFQESLQGMFSSFLKNSQLKSDFPLQIKLEGHLDPLVHRLRNHGVKEDT